jgi:hypothetical protein
MSPRAELADAAIYAAHLTTPMVVGCVVLVCCVLALLRRKGEE